MKIAKTKEATGDMVLDAMQTALERTFQGKYGEGVKNIQKGLNKLGNDYLGLGSEEFGFGNIVMPFTKTPANILGKAVEYSPIGIKDAIKELTNIKKGTFDQRKFSEAIGRSVTGTGLFVV